MQFGAVRFDKTMWDEIEPEIVPYLPEVDDMAGPVGTIEVADSPIAELEPVESPDGTVVVDDSPVGEVFISE
jgi:hypothetical protein